MLSLLIEGECSEGGLKGGVPQDDGFLDNVARVCRKHQNPPFLRDTHLQVA